MDNSVSETEIFETVGRLYIQNVRLSRLVEAQAQALEEGATGAGHQVPRTLTTHPEDAPPPVTSLTTRTPSEGTDNEREHQEQPEKDGSRTA